MRLQLQVALERGLVERHRRERQLALAAQVREQPAYLDVLAAQQALTTVGRVQEREQRGQVETVRAVARVLDGHAEVDLDAEDPGGADLEAARVDQGRDCRGVVVVAVAAVAAAAAEVQPHVAERRRRPHEVCLGAALACCGPE